MFACISELEYGDLLFFSSCSDLGFGGFGVLRGWVVLVIWVVCLGCCSVCSEMKFDCVGFVNLPWLSILFEILLWLCLSCFLVVCGFISFGIWVCGLVFMLNFSV